jgi:hypothetical protein
MKAVQQQPTDSVREQVIEVTAIGALVFFGAFMVFLGWLKYRDRNKSAGKGSKKRPSRSNKK